MSGQEARHNRRNRRTRDAGVCRASDGEYDAASDQTVAATVTIGQSPPASGGQFPWETPAIVGGSLALAASIAGTTYVVRRNARQHGAER